MKKLFVVMMFLTLSITPKQSHAFDIRESGIACAALGAMAMFVFDQDTQTSGIVCALGAASQPLIENHYKQKHGREHRQEVQELKNINQRYKNLSWIRGKRLGEPQYIIEKKKIPARQTGTSIREAGVEYKFSLPDTSGTAIGD